MVALLLDARADVDAASSSLEEGAEQLTAGGEPSKESPMETGSAPNEMTTSVEADATCATWNCDRPAATGYMTCCRTCMYSEGTGHGAICQKANYDAFKDAEGCMSESDGHGGFGNLA